jgi:hypothetical protein
MLTTQSYNIVLMNHRVTTETYMVISTGTQLKNGQRMQALKLLLHKL